jgi:5-(carboxyamino)imidazole ribonucleotide synthase
MLNLIGSEPSAYDVLAVEGAHLHRYGKESRPGRKLGHVTVIATDADVLRRRVLQVSAVVPIPDPWPI